jgi:glycogen debranching enzyme
MASKVSFDVNEVPFSRRGSWLDLSPTVGLQRIVEDVHLVSHQNGMHAVLSLVPTRAGERAEVEVSASPSVLRWAGPSGLVEAVFADESTIRIRGEGMGIEISDTKGDLTSFTGAYLMIDPRDGSALFTSYETGRRYRITTVRGTPSVMGAGQLGTHRRAVTIDGSEPWELAIEEFDSARAPLTFVDTFDDAVAVSARSFDTYLEALAPWRSDRTPASALAAYILWSATVSPGGFIGRVSILMSKHWMDKVWSWDHCINAIALAPTDAAAAVDQFLLPFDLMSDTGSLPDSVTHSEVLYNYVKPPIHGWALTRMRERLERPLTAEELDEIYGALSRWTHFWLEMRRVPNHVLAHYQHGNDSGWDNSTMFDNDTIVEAPDLAAFLIIQLDVLADLADELGLDAAAWRAERDRIRAALINDLWDDKAFYAVGLPEGRRSKISSLQTTLPIVAAAHLPKPLVAALAERISTFVTSWGLATQLVNTPEYEPDGYWRGPIWAPSTILIQDGLRSAGYGDLADDISDRFMRLCERSGFAENFDALSGDGLRDRAYTWTASAYLLLAAAAEQRRSS